MVDQSACLKAFDVQNVWQWIECYKETALDALTRSIFDRKIRMGQIVRVKSVGPKKSRNYEFEACKSNKGAKNVKLWKVVGAFKEAFERRFRSSKRDEKETRRNVKKKREIELLEAPKSFWRIRQPDNFIQLCTSLEAKWVDWLSARPSAQLEITLASKLENPIKFWSHQPTRCCECLRNRKPEIKSQNMRVRRPAIGIKANSKIKFKRLKESFSKLIATRFALEREVENTFENSRELFAIRSSELDGTQCDTVETATQQNV